ncbi:unnamed protein product [Hermetia illucens]|uniref:glycerol kinase n=1 Tax=Hermetia illucens TaxID=343691 RepID=A0A7R8YUV6_HERIL|nr:glycerol kinase [Hermetia illucens]CAD7086602.1 unnamed protein product [Hermetia illucens]
MERCGKFGPLLGVISVGNVYCKFLVYAARNAEILTCHEIKLKQIIPQPGWLEFDPNELWANVVECMEVSCRNLIILDIDPGDILAVGISNQRGSCLLWNKRTGNPLCNIIAWTDTRTSSVVKNLLSSLRGKINYLKSVCGLPISTCFSAIKLKWLQENVPSINQGLYDRNCCFGTLDSWILWNLTGGTDEGKHATDVTNAAYTMLMNLEQRTWDPKLCAFFQTPSYVLPEIKSCSEIYGFVRDGPLRGVPIASIMGDQPAALLGQLCIKPQKGTCTLDEGCYILFNTGQEIIDSDNGLLSTVAFQLGSKQKTFYCLEGAVPNAGAAVTWLKESLYLNVELKESNESSGIFNTFAGNSTMASSDYSSPVFANSSTGEPTAVATANAKRGDVVFVPAFSGLYSPFWKHDARGLLLGINSNTTSENIFHAAYEATCYQARDLLHSFHCDTKTWTPLTKLIVGGEFSENAYLLQLLADITGLVIERPQTTSPSCLGVMLAAGTAVGVISLENSLSMYIPPSDIFHPTTTINRREILHRRWEYAIKKCINWDNFENFDEELATFTQQEKNPYLSVHNSIPGGLFLTTSFVLLIIARFLQSSNIS